MAHPPIHQLRRGRVAHGPEKLALGEAEQTKRRKRAALRAFWRHPLRQDERRVWGIISRLQVTIITDEKEVEKHLSEASASYTERDKRVAGLTDESVSEFYSCTLCQSFAPCHVCIISPERLGLCGALNWLDAAAGFSIDPNGPNKPVEKGAAIDEQKGQWSNVNEAVRELTHGRIERMNQYTMMEDPQTSCGCFECIVAISSDLQGVIVVNRESTGMTPIGAKFSTLAGSVGGGNQTPGFIGIGRQFITSKKFIRCLLYTSP